MKYVVGNTNIWHNHKKYGPSAVIDLQEDEAVKMAKFIKPLEPLPIPEGEKPEAEKPAVAKPGKK